MKGATTTCGFRTLVSSELCNGHDDQSFCHRGLHGCNWLGVLFPYGKTQSGSPLGRHTTFPGNRGTLQSTWRELLAVQEHLQRASGLNDCPALHLSGVAVRGATKPTGSDPLHCSRSQRKHGS